MAWRAIKGIKKMIEMPAANDRFHASEGVFPKTVLCGFGSLSHARTFMTTSPA